MVQPNDVQTDINGLGLHIVSTEKYKTNTIVLMLKAPLSKETVGKRALLPHVLQSGTNTLPSRQQIRNQLDELYGAALQVDVQKKGENHVIVFRLDIANENFIQDETPVFEKGMELLANILLQPKTEGHAFDPAIVEGEKRSLSQRIQSIYDDKMRYANLRITEEMCQDEPFGLSVYGKEEDVKTINAESLFTYYQEVISTDAIDLYIVGDIDVNKVKSTVKQYFQLPNRKTLANIANNVSEQPVPSKENIVFEEQDVKQGKLHMGYRTYTSYGEKDYYALQVFNGLYGGFSHSKLFMNVREKESLAYYAASRFESHKGILMVMSGIEFSNYDKAVKIIKEQMEAMKKGDFDTKEIEQTKAMIKNQLLETVDVAKAYIELLYHNVVANQKSTLEDWLNGIDAVTKEDIISVANKVKLDTIYFLKGKGGTK